MQTTPQQTPTPAAKTVAPPAPPAQHTRVPKVRKADGHSQGD